ncbi:MAG: hypothetical protein IID28_15785, partial [Planctomycetes bacterium]|nr:hypothetical protein [Planctomycetota bacterium]
TQPCHPWRGQPLPIERWDRLTSQPRVHVRLPDGTTQCVPLAWTDQADPNVDESAHGRGIRLSVVALLEAVKWVDQTTRTG